LGTGRGGGKWRDVPYGECGVKKLERKFDEDSRKNKNAFSIPLLWLRLSASSASCVALLDIVFGKRLFIVPFGCGCWLPLRVVLADRGCWLRLRVVPADCGCWLPLRVVPADRGCWLRLRVVLAGCGSWLRLPSVAVGNCCWLHLLTLLLIKVADCACVMRLLVMTAGFSAGCGWWLLATSDDLCPPPQLLTMATASACWLRLLSMTAGCACWLRLPAAVARQSILADSDHLTA
jgi:hypothetical protein